MSIFHSLARSPHTRVRSLCVQRKQVIAVLEVRKVIELLKIHPHSYTLSLATRWHTYSAFNQKTNGNWVHDKLASGLIKIWIPVDNDKLKFKADGEKKGIFVYVKFGPCRCGRHGKKHTAQCEHHVKMYIIICVSQHRDMDKKTQLRFFLLLIIHNSIKVGSFATTSPFSLPRSPINFNDSPASRLPARAKICAMSGDKKKFAGLRWKRKSCLWPRRRI